MSWTSNWQSMSVSLEEGWRLNKRNCFEGSGKAT
jgi:hypothetical protein